jgi:DNA polymerase I
VPVLQDVEAAPSYGYLTSTDQLRLLTERLISDGQPFAFDIETGYDGPAREKAALRPEENFIAGFSVTNALTWARYVPLRHDEADNLDNAEVAVLLWPLLQTGLGVGHGLIFEVRCMSRWFVEYLGDHPLFGKKVRESGGYFPVRSDTLIERYNQARYKFIGLKAVTEARFGHKMIELHELFADLPKNKRKTLRFNTLPLTPKVVTYACEDSVWSLAHHLDCYPQVRDHFLYKVDMELLYVLARKADTGVRYDWEHMRAGAARGREFMDKLAAEIQADLSAALGRTVLINLGSPPQLAKVLYEDLGLTTRRTTEKGAPSTDKIALKGLAGQHAVVQKILWWKQVKRLTEVYLGKYESKYAWAGDGMTHPVWQQCAVITGRGAVEDPPYQQSPKKYHFVLTDGSEFTYNFRDAIAAPPGCYQLGFDLSQAELRAIAGEAQEQALIEAFRRGLDVHKFTASQMLGVPFDQVQDEQRAMGKTLNFALVYQMGVDGLAERLVCSTEEAERLFAQYFATYPAIKRWTDQTVRDARANGYVMTRFGRRVPIWEYQDERPWIRRAGDRLAGNAPIQGAATGDYMRIAKVRADRAIRAVGWQDKVRLFMDVHDALEYYVDESLTPDEVIRVLEPAVVFPVEGWPPMVADWHAGWRWGSVRELKRGEDGHWRAEGVVARQVEETADEDTEDEQDASPARFVRPAPRTAPPVPAAATRPVVALEQRQEPAAASDSVPRTVVVRLARQPDAESFQRFLALVDSRPGVNTVELTCPEGTATMPRQTSLSPADRAQVSLLLGGADVLWHEGSVDMAAVAAGLSL